MRNMKSYPVNILEELYWDGRVESGEYNLELISKEINNQSRWETWHDVVFKDLNDSSFYTACYGEGSTEYQESTGFETDADEMVECVEVVPVTRTVTVYKVRELEES